MIRVLVAEDMHMIRGALVALLTREADMEVVAELDRGDRILKAALATQPDVAVLDIDLPGLDGLSAAELLHDRANVAALLLGASWFAFVFAGSIYMQRVLHYSPLQNGAAWLAASVTSLVLAGLSQLLVTRIGAKRVTAIGMTMIGASIIWATRIPAHAHFLADLAGPFVLGGAGTAFSFIPISVAALDGVSERQSGLASGLLNTSTQFGAAIGTAIASSVAASGASSLLRAGDGARVALAGGFHQTFWVLGVTALLAPPAVFALMRRERATESEAKSKSADARQALASTS